MSATDELYRSPMPDLMTNTSRVSVGVLTLLTCLTSLVRQRGLCLGRLREKTNQQQRPRIRATHEDPYIIDTAHDAVAELRQRI